MRYFGGEIPVRCLVLTCAIELDCCAAASPAETNRGTCTEFLKPKYRIGQIPGCGRCLYIATNRRKDNVLEFMRGTYPLLDARADSRSAAGGGKRRPEISGSDSKIRERTEGSTGTIAAPEPSSPSAVEAVDPFVERADWNGWRYEAETRSQQ